MSRSSNNSSTSNLTSNLQVANPTLQPVRLGSSGTRWIALLFRKQYDSPERQSARSGLSKSSIFDEKNSSSAIQHSSSGLVSHSVALHPPHNQPIAVPVALLKYRSWHSFFCHRFALRPADPTLYSTLKPRVTRCKRQRSTSTSPHLVLGPWKPFQTSDRPSI